MERGWSSAVLHLLGFREEAVLHSEVSRHASDESVQTPRPHEIALRWEKSLFLLE